jgi:hypothetical protein
MTCSRSKNWADDLDDDGNDDQNDNVAVEPATEDDIVVERDSTRTGAVFRKDEPVERKVPVEEREPVAEGELVVKEAPVVGDGPIAEDEPVTLSSATLPKQVVLATSRPQLPTEPPLDSWGRLPMVACPLICKTDRSPPQLRSVASDYIKMAMPEFSLVFPKMAAVIRIGNGVLRDCIRSTTRPRSITTT